MNSDKRIINVVGSMGGLKTTKSSLSWEGLKKRQGRHERLFQTELTMIVDKSSPTAPCSASGIYHYNPKKPQYQLL